MRTVATCGGLFLLLLIYEFAAFVVDRRSPDAGPSPASISDSSGADPPAAGPSGAAPPGSPTHVHSSHPLAWEGEPVRASGLVLGCGAVDLGDLDPGEFVTLEIPWRRTGRGPLRVREVRTGCGCLVVSGLPEVVDEGLSGDLRLEVHVPIRAGPFEVAVQALTDRAPEDVVRVDVLGYSGHEFSVDPPTLDLGTMLQGRSVERIVSVRLPTTSGRPGAPDAPVRARLVGLDGTVVVHPPWTGRRRGPVRERGAEVVVAPATAASGDVDGTLEVSVGDAPPRRIAVRGRVAEAPP